MRYLNCIRFFIPILIALLILVVLFSRIDPAKIFVTLKESNKTLLFISIPVLFTVHLIGALRWRTALIMLGHRVPFWTILRFYLANVPISKITPSYSGDFVRTHYLRDKISVAHHVGVIFLEALFDVFILATLATIGGIAFGVKIAVLPGLILLIAIAAFFIISTRIKLKVLGKWQGIAENLLTVFQKLFFQPKLFLAVVLYSLMMWVLIIGYIKLSFLAFGVSVPTVAVAALQPIAIFVSLLPISIGGIGIRESAMVFLFSRFASDATILAVGLIYSLAGSVLLPLLLLPVTYKIMREVICIRKK